MASALYDEGHPLYEYFQASADDRIRTIPGGLGKIGELDDEEWARGLSLASQLSSLIARGKMLFAASPPRSNRAFAERFKYIIISSPLLSSAVSTIPLDAPDPLPREDTSKASRKVARTVPPATPRASSVWHMVVPMPSTRWVMPIVGATAMASRRITIVVATTAWILKMFYHPTTVKGDILDPFSTTFNAMNDLISASDVWDNLVGKSLGVLDSEEMLAIATPASGHLKSALIAAFDSTRVQSDSVRQLFAPLTSALELSMLSEMYSPSAGAISPIPSHIHIRGASASILRSPPSHASVFSKRSTWNGAARTRQTHAASELDSDPDCPHSPPSPSIASFLSEVPHDSFGSFALGIARNRRRTAKARRDFPSERPSSPFRQSTRPSSTQFGRAQSPFTSPASPLSRPDSTRSSPRRPCSYSSLRSSLECAVMARRYAASHLLALRFDEDPLDVYWEDVTSVMNLFSKALLDASSSLAEALNEYLAARMAEQIPTPPPSKIKRPSDAHETATRDIFGTPISPLSSPPAVIGILPSVELSSFAPMPTDLAQFAAHMDITAKSIEAAQKELRVCLTALQSPPTSRGDREQETQGGNDVSVCQADPLSQQVMDSYDRLRRDLGAALRECERSKGSLTSALHGGAARDRDGSDEDAGALSPGLEVSGNETKGILPISPASSNSSLPYVAELETGIDNAVQVSLSADVFDDFINTKRLEAESVGSHISANGSGRNPFTQPDPEQIYEATIPPATAQLREKSKMSRAERIRQMRERRAAGGATVLSDIPGSSSDERASEKNGKIGYGHMGPGGDVVQELQSVINLVGERRRGAGSSTSLTTTSSPLSRSHSTRSPSPQPPPEPPSQPDSAAPALRDEPENEPPVRSRTSSAGTTRASKPQRLPPPPTDGFDTDTFGPRENRSSPSLPSSPSPPGSPSFPPLELPPSTVSASNSPIQMAASSHSPHPSLPNRVSSLLAALPPRPPRPNRPNRQLPAVPVTTAAAIQS